MKAATIDNIRECDKRPQSTRTRNAVNYFQNGGTSTARADGRRWQCTIKSLIPCLIKNFVPNIYYLL